MIVNVNADAVDVLGATDLTRLHVESGLDRAQIDVALRKSGLGLIDASGEAHLRTSVLRRQALDQIPSAQIAHWESSWEQMLQYASSKGWTREEGDVVVAHVQATGP